MAIYKCTNNNNISKAYSRLRDMWVNSYENDYNAYEFLTFGAKKAGKDILITAVFCLTLIFAEIFFLCSCNNQLALRAFVQLKVTFAPISVLWFRGTPINSGAWTVGKNILQ